MRAVKTAHEAAPPVTTEPWQLQTAKARFSEVFRKARSEGPQWITRQGKEAVVVLPAQEYEKLKRRRKQHKSLVRFFAESPLAGSGIDLERQPDYGRPVDL
jgi:prevent-host-death family protein